MNREHIICAHHIGGRNGSFTFPELPAFGDELVHVLYDADENCLGDLSELQKAQGNPKLFLSACFWSSATDAELNVYFDQCASSLLAVNDTIKDGYTHWPDCDYLFRDAFALEKTIPLRTVAFDDFLASKENQVPDPTFLSIDTQGAEYDILLGAKQSIARATLGIVCEVEFFPIYRDQKLFSDIVSLLDEMGFYLAGFLEKPAELSLHRSPVGARGNGFMAYTDALFLKKSDLVSAMNTNQSEAQGLLKLALISLAFGYMEYAHHCVMKAKAIEPDVFDPIDGQSLPKYIEFLKKVTAETEALKDHKVTYKDIRVETAEERSRLQDASKQRLRHLVKTSPVFAIKLAFKYMAHAFRLKTRHWVETQTMSDFEKLLVEHGLMDVAIAVKEKRR